MNVLLFNGPPSSGKDTCMKILMNNWTQFRLPGKPAMLRMSHPIKRAFAGMVNRQIDEAGNVDGWENRKDQHDKMLGSSYRQWQINFSEKFMKPLYGEDIFARLFVESIPDYKASIDLTIIVPDCGFQIELDAIIRLRPHWRAILCRVYRDNCDFSNDSRGYLSAVSSRFVDIHNNGTLDDLQDTLRQVAEHGWFE